MPITVLGGTTSAAAAFEVANSCRFNGGEYMHKSLSATATHADKCTFSIWVKPQVSDNRNTFVAAGVDSGNYMKVRLQDDKVAIYGNRSSQNDLHVVTNRVLRDPSAWYHIVLQIDTTQSTAGNRVKFFVNGVQETSLSTTTYMDQNADCFLNGGVSSSKLFIGAFDTAADDGVSEQGEGYFAEVALIDGSILAPTEFGEYDEDSPTIWKPKDISGLTFGANGFYLDFEDSSNLGNDANGGTDLTEVNLAAADQATDTPTNSFCTMNPLEKHASTTLKEGNLDLSTTASGWHGASTTMGITLGSGPWYFEAKAISSARLYFGLSRIGQGVRGITYANSTEGDSDFDYMWRVTSANTVYYGGSDQSITIAAISANDICACHVATDGEVKFYKNDSLVVTFSTKLVDGYFYFPILSANAFGGGTESWQANFGNPPYANSSSQSDPDGYGDFEYATKSGYALCTKNLGAYGG